MTTINELMVLIKVVKERLNDLKALRSQLAVRETYYTTATKTVEPQYNVKDVDKKITELQNFIYLADAKIKTTNAATLVNFEFDVTRLLEPLQ